MVSVKIKPLAAQNFRVGRQTPIIVARVITVILLILSAWALGRIAWSFISPAPSAQTAKSKPKAAPPPPPPSAPSYQIGQLIKQNFFGKYEADDPSADLSGAPRTKLNLTLVGVVASTEPNQGIAIIANGELQESYTVGDQIKGSQATLAQVLRDRIVIRNSGVDEILFFAGADAESAIAPGVLPTMTSGNNATTAASRARPAKAPAGNNRQLDQIKQEILKNPQSLLKYITLSMQRNGEKLVGYRVSPGADKRLFAQADLKDGDIATEINGVNLTDSAELTQIWQNLSDATEINLTVLRNGQVHKVYIGL
ncbi:MAG: type II secretion system protein GspC [Vibrionaceae bacterium]